MIQVVQYSSLYVGALHAAQQATVLPTHEILGLGPI
jgi:hypothetical protein